MSAVSYNNGHPYSVNFPSLYYEVGNDKIPVSNKYFYGVKTRKFKRCTLGATVTGDTSGTFYPPAPETVFEKNFSTVATISANYTATQYSDFWTPLSDGHLNYDIYSPSVVGEQVNIQAYIESWRDSIVYNVSFAINGPYGFTFVAYKGPTSFKTLNSYNIDNRVIGALDGNVFDQYLDQNMIKANVPSVSASAYNDTVAPSVVSSVVNINSALTNPTKRIEIKLLNLADVTTCINTSANSYDVAFWDSLTSPTISEAIASGGCQYFGVLKHVRPILESGTITVTGTGYTDQVIVPFSQNLAKASVTFSYDGDSDPPDETIEYGPIDTIQYIGSGQYLYRTDHSYTVLKKRVPYYYRYLPDPAPYPDHSIILMP